ncbi:hypothetical protein TELCIR_11453, partial [Teladorsagia circumcincta]
FTRKMMAKENVSIHSSTYRAQKNEQDQPISKQGIKTTKNRRDLQGIRGIAISAVVLFHFFPKYFPNGHIGVDQ